MSIKRQMSWGLATVHIQRKKKDYHTGTYEDMGLNPHQVLADTLALFQSGWKHLPSFESCQCACTANIQNEITVETGHM